MCMIVHDSFWSALFPKNRRAQLKWLPKVPWEAQLQVQKFVFIFKMITMTKKILKIKITEKISSKESIYLKELEETSQEKKCITKPLYLGKMGNVARWNNDLILHLIDKHEACHAFGTFFLPDCQ